MLPTLAGSGSVCGMLTGWVSSGAGAGSFGSPGSWASGTRIGRPALLVPAVTGSRWAGILTAGLGPSPPPPRDHQRVPFPVGAGGPLVPRAAAPMMSSARAGRGFAPFAGPPFGGADVGTPETGTADTGTPDTGTPDTGAADTGTAETGTAETG